MEATRFKTRQDEGDRVILSPREYNSLLPSYFDYLYFQLGSTSTDKPGDVANRLTA